MRKVWYMYKNGYDFGMRVDGKEAIDEILRETGSTLEQKKYELIIKSGYFRDREFEAIKQTIKK